MGFYIKKSFGLGPFKINVSKSGIGFSCGEKGLRVGTGPKGNYIHAGRKGIYYRKKIGINLLILLMLFATAGWAFYNGILQVKF